MTRTPSPRTELRRLQAEQAARTVLELVTSRKLSFTDRGLAGTAYRVDTDTGSRTLTPIERRTLLALLEGKQVKHVRRWMVHRGMVEPVR